MYNTETRKALACRLLSLEFAHKVTDKLRESGAHRAFMHLCVHLRPDLASTMTAILRGSVAQGGDQHKAAQISRHKLSKAPRRHPRARHFSAAKMEFGILADIVPNVAMASQYQAADLNPRTVLVTDHSYYFTDIYSPVSPRRHRLSHSARKTSHRPR